MSILPTIQGPADLSKLSTSALHSLAQEIRDFLINNVSATGGHLGPNLGVVEITLAIHRVFDSPRDSIIFDTGHQSYVHKLLTGRQDFSALRQQGGLAGYPDRSESIHDIVESSHASSSLSWAEGISRAYALDPSNERYVVPVIGDGALTGGMAWEALNNIAADNNRRAVIVVNDNGRSYAPTVGGLANQLAKLRRGVLDKLRTHQVYENVMDNTKQRLLNGGQVSAMIYRSLHAAKKGAKDFWAPQGLFEDLGMKYIGPIDGHNQEALEEALRDAHQYQGPVIVHAITEKGRGYAPARADVNDQFHAVGIIDPETGEAVTRGSARSWTSVFEEEIAAIGSEREDIVALTAAMMIPVGLRTFARDHPDRVVDVGIAEQHAVASAAGLAFGGKHPVVALYATFLNRAFDQVLMDIALHKAGVTFVLDRAGVTGPDGPSHHGMWDLSLLQIVPGIRIAAPRDSTRLREELREAVAVADAPTVLRFSKGSVNGEIDALERFDDGVEVLKVTGARDAEPTADTAHPGFDYDNDVLIVSVGAMAQLSLDVAQRLCDQGITATVVDPRWVLPVSESVVSLAARHRIVITIEDGVRVGGVGSRLRQTMREAGVDTALHEVGLPVEFLTHGSRDEVLARVGLTATQITHDTVSQVLGMKVPFARRLPGEDEPTGEIPVLRQYRN